MKLRKIVSLLMAACIGLAGLPLTPEIADEISITAFAQTETTDDGFRYNALSNESAEIYRYNGTATDVVIPSIIDGKTITKICEEAFRNNETITSVKIPETVTEISRRAFDGCTNLKTVNLPSSLTLLGGEAFKSCSIVNIEIPDGVDTLSFETFQGCRYLESVSLPSGLKYVGENAFCSCGNLKRIMLPDSVTSIGSWAFSSCSQLTEIILPSSVTYIGENAFYGCSRLTSIVIPENVRHIRRGSFDMCSLLKDITILNPDCEIYSVYGDAISTYRTFLGKIHGYEGSTAQAYAEQYGYTFVPIGGEDHSVKLAYLSDKAKNFSYKYFEEDLNTLLDQTPSDYYDPRLSYMLSIVAQSAYDPIWAEFNYNNLGFMDKTFYDYDTTYTQADNCGYVLGYQDLPDGTREYLIDVRGTANALWEVNGTEWWSDFNAGSTILDASGLYPKDHYGFDQAATRLIISLQDYCGGEIPTENVRFILTGHSRGAAVANLVARHLINYGVSTEDVYAYTFACPGVAIDFISSFRNLKYRSIFNINCARDLVGQAPNEVATSLSPSFWGTLFNKETAQWGKYGQTLFWDNDWSTSTYPNVFNLDTYHPCDKNYIPFLATDDGTGFRNFEQMHNIQARNAVLLPLRSAGKYDYDSIHLKPLCIDMDMLNESIIKIQNDEQTAMTVNDGAIKTLVDNIFATIEDGKLYLDLPVDTDYTIEVSSPEGNASTVGIADYTAEFGVTSAGIYEVPESAGSYTITIPADESSASVTTADGKKVTPFKTWLLGDVNGDGSVNVSDVVLLQKWLLAVPNTELSDWKAADCYADYELDVFDLCMMKRMLINR